MIERDVGVTSRNGIIPSFAVCPDGPGSDPGIIPERDVYDAHAAEASWAKIIAMWDRNLK